MKKTIKILAFFTTLFLLFATCACKVPPSDTAQKPDSKPADVSQTQDTTIRAMSYNIRLDNPLLPITDTDSWEKRKEPLVKHIQKYMPDLIGTQEVRTTQLQYLGEKLGELGYEYVAMGRNPDNKDERNAIYYQTSRFELVDSNTFWLSSTPETASMYEGAGCYRICTYAVLLDKITGETLTHYNTHLDHISEDARQFGANVIMEHIPADTGYCILTGDFNTTEAGEAYATITTRLNDSAKTAETAETGLTFHAYKENHFEGNPIDFIFTSQSIKVLSYCVLQEKSEGVFTSDHYAVMVDFTYKPKA